MIYKIHSASGRIVSTYATDNFESLKDVGYIYVEVENTGEVTADFAVSSINLNHIVAIFVGLC